MDSQPAVDPFIKVVTRNCSETALPIGRHTHLRPMAGAGRAFGGIRTRASWLGTRQAAADLTNASLQSRRLESNQLLHVFSVALQPC